MTIFVFVGRFQRSLFTAIFAILSVAPASSQAQQKCSLVLQEVPSSKAHSISRTLQNKINYLQPTLDQIRDHVTAVHVTDQLPQDGFLRAAIHNSMGLRPTVHFALGQMVVGHQSGNWEQKKYAILVPFRQLEPQLLSVFHQDTFIIGDLKLAPGTTIIVPANTHPPTISGVEFISYEPEQTTLRKKIDQVLKERRQWQIKAEGGNDYNKVYLKKNLLEQKSFFSSVYERYPHVTFGLHASHPMGRIDHFMAENFGIFQNAKATTVRNYVDWTLQLQILRRYLRESDQAAKTFENQADVKAVYKKARDQFAGNLKIFEAEIELQKSYGRTLLGTPDLPPSLLLKIRQVSHNKSDLTQLLTENISRLEKTPEDNVTGAEELKEILYNTDLEDIRTHESEKDLISFFKNEPDLLFAAGGIEFQLALRKIELFTQSRQTHDQINDLQEVFLKQLKTCQPRLDKCVSLIFLLLDPSVEPIRGTVLDDPEVNQRLSKNFDLKAFTHLKTDDRSSWISLAISLRNSKDKARTWAQAIRMYHFVEVQH